MNIEKIKSEDLKHEFKVTLPFQDIEKKITTWLEKKAKVVKMPGFRPGKVPLNIVRQCYESDAVQNVLDRAVHEATSKIFKENKLRPAFQPDYNFDAYETKKDFSFTMAVEILPEIEVKDFASIDLERLVCEVSEEDVNKTLNEFVKVTPSFNEKNTPAEEGDRVSFNLKTIVNNKVLKPSSANNLTLVIGEESYYPAVTNINEIAKLLAGKKASESFTTEHEFDADFPDKTLAGKKATFEVEVTRVEQKTISEANEEFAKSLKFENLQQLKDKIRENITNERGRLSRLHQKRYLLDYLSQEYNFDLPQRLIQAEFDAIWNRLQQEMKEARENGTLDPEDDKPEEELKKEYNDIAVRRVKLGLLISEIAQKNNIRITEEMARNLVIQEALRYPGHERTIVEYYRNTPRAIDQLTSPILEDMVIDFILEKVKVSEKTVGFDEFKQKLALILPGYDDVEETEEDVKEEKKKTPAKKASKKKEVSTEEGESSSEENEESKNKVAKTSSEKSKSQAKSNKKSD